MNLENFQVNESPETEILASIENIEFELLELRQLVLMLAMRSEQLQPLPTLVDKH